MARDPDPSLDPTITRRDAIGLVLAAAGAAAVLGRRPRSRAGIPAGRTTIDYWEKWTGPEGDAIQRIVDRFNASQSRIWVRRVPVSEITSKAMVAISGGDPPDVVGLFSYNIPQFAESRAALPLDELGPSASRIDADAYIPAVRRLLSHEGRLWAGVGSLYNLALYYNREHFRKAGMDPDRPPRTITELDAAAQKLTVLDAGRVTHAGFLQNLPAWWPYFWPSMFGGRLYDPASNRALLTDDATAAAYEWVQSYPRRFGPAATAEFGNVYSRSFHSPQDPFISGAVSMIVQGPWIANFIRLYAPQFDYGAAPVPVADALYDPEKPTGMLEADVLIIPRGCRHPEAAYEFVRYTQQREVQEALCLEHCKSSPLREVSPGFLENHPNRYVRVHDAITRSPAVQVLPQTRVWQPYADMLVGAFDAIWRGAEVRPTLRTVESRAQALMDQAALRRRQREAKA